MLKSRIAALFVTLILIGKSGWAQIEFVPIPTTEQDKASNQRVKQGHNAALELPFWDDFSTADQVPDTSKWLNSASVTISNSAALNPPTINVALFDGFNAWGKPYSNKDENGLADTLISQILDLSGLTDQQKQTTFLSFYWQAQGLGDQPNPGDSIRLQFKSNKNKWYTFWKQTGATVNPAQFRHVLPIRIENLNFEQDETFFFDAFQFRFQAFGNLSGGFDHWMIDYIYLNHSRSFQDTVYFDRALTTAPSSLFKPFTSIPKEAFFNLEPDQLGSPAAGFYNLSNEGLQALDFSLIIRENLTKKPIDTVNYETVLSPLPGAFERRKLNANQMNPGKYDQFKDSASFELESLFYLKTNDTIVTNRNYRVNDTVKSVTKIANYYAYDDGSAEIGAGISKRGAQLAYRYILNQPDTITHIDIYFPAFLNTQAATTIKLFVWKRLDGQNSSILHQETFPLQLSDQINELKRYTLSRNIVIEDTCYIGYEQNIDELLPVGFDRNTNSSNQIFFNRSAQGAWEVYDEETTGSLMLRPIFSEAIVTGIDPDDAPFEEVKLKLYPNPTRSHVNIDGPFQEVLVFDIRGNLLHQTSQNQITLSGWPAGIYLFKVKTKKQILTHRILLLE